MPIVSATSAKAQTDQVNAPEYEKYANERIGRAVSAGQTSTDMTFRTNADAEAARTELVAAGYSVSQVQNLNWPLDTGHLLQVNWTGSGPPSPSPAPPAPAPAPAPTPPAPPPTPWPPPPAMQGVTLTTYTSVAPGIDSGQGPLQLIKDVPIDTIVAELSVPISSWGFGVVDATAPGLSFYQSGPTTISITGTPTESRAGYWFTILVLNQNEPYHIPPAMGAGVYVNVSDPPPVHP